MARQSPDDPSSLEDELGDLDVMDDDADSARDAAVESFWAELRIEPVELSLPTGTGYTLRAYRAAAELTPTEIERVAEEDLFETRRRQPDLDDESDADDADEDDVDDAALEEAEEEEEEEAEEVEDEEDVPVFLGHRGRLYLFRTPESLVEFVRSGAEHDMTQLDTWADLADRIRPEDVAAAEEDSYELDLVVDNLRGGHDAWDAELLIGAGEVARDVAYAFRVEPILTALSAGSPLDDLDEALRATVPGGLGGYFARRRLRKIGIQQATLGWRTIIGKISGVVDWRD